MARSSGRWAQQARTQLVKQAENKAGLIQFIMIVSQRHAMVIGQKAPQDIEMGVLQTAMAS